MSSPIYTVEILDSSRQPITQVKGFVPLNLTGDYLEYSKYLSEPGKAKFRVATLDKIFVQYGDILQPWVNHIRISRNGQMIWQGMIVDIPHRNDKFLEVEAYTYLYLLKTRRIKHDTETVAGDGKDQYRTFSSGTLAAAVTAMLNETISTGNGVLSSVTVGQIDNPNYPAGFTDLNKNPLTGPWVFNSSMTMQFSYADVFTVLNQLGVYAVCDFELTDNLAFNWKTKIGVDHSELVFNYGQYGSIEAFNSPLYGSRLVNDLIGIAADIDGNILHSPKTDEASKAKYGRHDGEAGFSDVTNPNALVSRTVQELNLVSTPDAEITATLNERAFPLGTYGLGDTVTFDINYGPIKLHQPRRVIGIDVRVDNNGRERVILSTNKPRTT